MYPRARRDGMLAKEIGEELVLYDRESDQVHSLNRTAAFVWKQCDGETSVEQMAALLAVEFGLPADERAVWLALEQLERVNLLTERLKRAPGAPRTSRREVIRRLGLVGAAGFLLPMVRSITAPTPAMAQYAGPGQLRCECRAAKDTCTEPLAYGICRTFCSRYVAGSAACTNCCTGPSGCDKIDNC